MKGNIKEDEEENEIEGVVLVKFITDTEAQVCVTVEDGKGIVREVMLNICQFPSKVNEFTHRHTHGFTYMHNTSS